MAKSTATPLDPDERWPKTTITPADLVAWADWVRAQPKCPIQLVYALLAMHTRLIREKEAPQCQP